MPQPLFREILDGLPCACCGGRMHGPMFPHGRCHRKSKLSLVRYTQGMCTISCGECSKIIIQILTLEPTFKVPEEPVETYYLEGKLYLDGHGTITVSSDPRLN